jgi:thioredoxin-related protein
MKPLLCSFVLLLTATLSIYASDWTTDYKAALAQAKAQQKLVLLDFTGSDWCGFCQLLEKEVFTQPEFHHYADQAFILVTVDYPHGTQLPDDLKQQNAALKQQLHPDGFPTLVVVDSDGKELGRKVGYKPGSGPQAVIDELKKISKN